MTPSLNGGGIGVKVQWFCLFLLFQVQLATAFKSKPSILWLEQLEEEVDAGDAPVFF